MADMAGWQFPLKFCVVLELRITEVYPKNQEHVTYNATIATTKALSTIQLLYITILTTILQESFNNLYKA